MFYFTASLDNRNLYTSNFSYNRRLKFFPYEQKSLIVFPKFQSAKKKILMSSTIIYI